MTDLGKITTAQLIRCVQAAYDAGWSAGRGATAEDSIERSLEYERGFTAALRRIAEIQLEEIDSGG